MAQIHGQPGGNRDFLSHSLRRFGPVVLAALLSWPLAGQTYSLSTFAGGGMPVNIPGPTAGLPTSPAVAVDGAGNVYFSGFFTVLRLDAVTGIVTLVAGNGVTGFSGDGGPAVIAQLTRPNSIAVDSAGTVYIADGNRIRKVQNGIITTIAGDGTAASSGDGGLAVNAQVRPVNLAVDAAGTLYFTNVAASSTIPYWNSGSVRKVSDGVITTVAGNGNCCAATLDNVAATTTPLYELAALAIDSSGSVYVASLTNTNIGNTGAIRKISGGVITTVPTGTTPATTVQGLAVDSAGSLYFSGYANRVVRKISGGTVTTVVGTGASGSAGDGGPATSATLSLPWGIALDASGNLYISDSGRIRKVTNGFINTIAGNGTFGLAGDGGPATSAQLFLPEGIAVDGADKLYIADQYNDRVRVVSNGIIDTVPGTAGLSGPTGVAVDAASNLYVAGTTDNRLREIANGVDTTLATVAFTFAFPVPQCVAVDSAGDIYISDNSGIQRFTNGALTTLPASGLGIALDAAGNLYIADAANNRIRKLSNGIFTTVAGNGTAGFSGDNGPAASAQLNAPQSVAVDVSGTLYVADSGNNRVRMVTNGTIVTIAGNGVAGFTSGNLPATSAAIEPASIAVDSAGNVYFSEHLSYRVRVLRPCVTTCPTAATPAITAVVNGASFQPGIEAGSWVTILGSGLANTNPGRIWAASEIVNGALPTSLDGVSVIIDGKLAYVEYVSPTQINVQAPADSALGSVNVVVDNNGAMSAPAPALLQAVAPAFFLEPGTNYAVASRLPDYTVVGTPSAPAKPGDTLVLWGTGFGATSPAVAAGSVVSGVPTLTQIPNVTLGGLEAETRATMTAGSAGLYQITIQVPGFVSTGAVALEAFTGTTQSPAGIQLYIAGGRQ